MKTKLRRFIYWFIGVLVVAFVLLLLPFNPPKWTASEISHRVDLLNEKAAIETPHHTLGKKTREANLALFEKVERGEMLSEEESAKYRVLYQSILNEKQHELSLLDGELTVLTNYKPDEKNNVGGMGIEGSHDHHDASAGANMVALWEDLAKLDQADGALSSYTRVRAAMAAYKDLDDIVLHMATAPQTKSVPRAEQRPADELQAQYEPMMFHFKRAQFEPVNSPAYIAEVHQALDKYAALVSLVQDHVYDKLGPVERSLVGRWGTWRTLAPPLGDVTTKRIPRTKAAS
jgi:hypothetical protein